jgi:ComF family protein
MDISLQPVEMRRARAAGVADSDAGREYSGGAEGCQPMGRVTVYSALDAVATWLLPPRCVLCGGRGQPEGLDLCHACENELPWLPVTADGAPPPCTLCHAPFAYEFPLTRLVPALKYERALANARVLGVLLGRSVERQGLARTVDAIVPMPLHSSRLESRGFNQSYEIARFTASVTGRPLAPSVLRRTRPTAPQVGLARAERGENVRGAFAAELQALRGRHLVLLDDVVTTGSTVAAAADALLAAGAARVDVWCVARAPG